MANIVASIGRPNGKVCDYALTDGADVNDLLAAAGETLKKGETLTVDGETVKGTEELYNGEVVIIEPSTTGA
jgi:hypothetical protein